MSEKERCPWCLKSELELHYHDTEWGLPRCTDAEQFEFLTLESAQAGLSWLTILKKREGYRQNFVGFDAVQVARFSPDDVKRLLQDPTIIRNRLKVEAAVNNARCFLELAARHGSFSRYIWGFVDGRPIQNQWTRLEEVPASTPLAQRIAKELKNQGFKFLGPTVLYAHMQASGMVNDHLISCFRHQEVAAQAEQRCAAL